ncbi:hypothetical protein SLE2022_054850 [Rubroshorea leprosula]
MLSLMEVLLSSDGKHELNERKGFILRSLSILVGKWWLTGRLEILVESFPLLGYRCDAKVRRCLLGGYCLGGDGKLIRWWLCLEVNLMFHI